MDFGPHAQIYELFPRVFRGSSALVLVVLPRIPILILFFVLGLLIPRAFPGYPGNRVVLEAAQNFLYIIIQPVSLSVTAASQQPHHHASRVLSILIVLVFLIFVVIGTRAGARLAHIAYALAFLLVLRSPLQASLHHLELIRIVGRQVAAQFCLFVFDLILLPAPPPHAKQYQRTSAHGRYAHGRDDDAATAAILLAAALRSSSAGARAAEDADIGRCAALTALIACSAGRARAAQRADGTAGAGRGRRCRRR